MIEDTVRVVLHLPRSLMAAAQVILHDLVPQPEGGFGEFEGEAAILAAVALGSLISEVGGGHAWAPRGEDDR